MNEQASDWQLDLCQVGKHFGICTTLKGENCLYGSIYF